MTPTSRTRFLTNLDPVDATRLLCDWAFWRRPSQTAPPGHWRYWVVCAGRGFGKTRTGAEWVRERVESGIARRITLIGRTAAEVRDIMIEGESGLLAICPPWSMPIYEPSKTRLTWPNGAVAQLFSAAEPESLRGQQSDTIWAEELASWRRPDAWSNAVFGLRRGANPQACVTTTPKPTKLFKDLLAHRRAVVTGGSSFDNAPNLASGFIDDIITPYVGTRIGRQEIDAILLDDDPDALWKRSDIDPYRLLPNDDAPLPAITRIVVGVDPAGSATGAETGIVVAGRDQRGHGYIFDDRSVRGDPNKWGSAVVGAYVDYLANVVVGETNNGGDMVGHVIQTVVTDQKTGPVTFKKVFSSRGKQARAEPVQALYKQGRIHHVGVFADLESQLCNWVPDQSAESPDRLDALVWALTELFITGKDRRLRSW